MELDINELLNFSPLMKTFTFNAWVVAGFTPITRGSTLDYYINRPQGMKGYIINLTLRGQARAKAGDGFLLCRENDLLLFPPRRAPSLRQGRTQRVLGPSVDLLYPPPLLDRLAKSGTKPPTVSAKQPLTIPTSSSSCAIFSTK